MNDILYGVKYMSVQTSFQSWLLDGIGKMDKFETPWTGGCQAPPSMGFFRQEYWSGLPSSPPGDLPNPEIKPMSPPLAGGVFTAEPLEACPQFRNAK